jgi:hypothetical protein
VLGRPAFANARPGLLARVRDAVQTWILERLSELFGSGAGGVVAWSLIGLAALALVAILIRLVVGVRGAGDVADRVDVTVAPVRRPDEWVAEARAARDRGAIADAVRFGYRAVVASLARRGDLDEVPGRTVGEYRRQVAARAPERTASFAAASEVFERVWYARRAATQDDVDAVLDVADHLVATR